MRRIVHRYNTGKVDGGKRIGHRGAGQANGRHVVVRAVDAVLNVELQVGAEGQQVAARQRDPVPHRTANAP